MGLPGEVEGSEGKGGGRELADESVEAGVGVAEVQGCEVGEAGVEGGWYGGGGGGRGGEGESGAAEVGEGEEALAYQGERLEGEVVVAAEAGEDGLPALVRQLFPRPRRRHVFLRHLPHRLRRHPKLPL